MIHVPSSFFDAVPKNNFFLTFKNSYRSKTLHSALSINEAAIQIREVIQDAGIQGPGGRVVGLLNYVYRQLTY